jgi:hypothetical protein
MARCDELGDRREPVGLGNSVGSDADAALTFKAGHGRVVNEPLDRAAREREFDAVTELHRVDLSPENRFEARPLRENSTATGTFRVTFAMAKNAGVRLSSGSKNDLTSVRAPKVKTSVIATKRTKARLAKLKISSWYEGAARSVGINKERPAEKRER